MSNEILLTDKERIKELEELLIQKDREISDLQDYQFYLDNQIGDLQDEVSSLEDDLESLESQHRVTGDDVVINCNGDYYAIRAANHCKKLIESGLSGIEQIEKSFEL